MIALRLACALLLVAFAGLLYLAYAPIRWTALRALQLADRVVDPATEGLP